MICGPQTAMRSDSQDGITDVPRFEPQQYTCLPHREITCLVDGGPRRDWFNIIQLAENPSTLGGGTILLQ